MEVALDHPQLSSRELAVKLTDEQRVFISKSSVYRILKAKGLITTPAPILLSASSEFKEQPCFVHQTWQTDFTYFKVVGQGWYYLSTILDDFRPLYYSLRAVQDHDLRGGGKKYGPGPVKNRAWRASAAQAFK